MKGFSHFILVSTLDLAVEAMPLDYRVGNYVEEIRRSLGCSPQPDELWPAVTDLSEIASQHGQFFIAARLQEIARQLARRVESDVNRALMRTPPS